MGADAIKEMEKEDVQLMQKALEEQQIKKQMLAQEIQDIKAEIDQMKTRRKQQK